MVDHGSGSSGGFSDGMPFSILLGVAQDGGFPQAGCRSRCCRAAWANPKRRRRVVSLGIVDPSSGQRWLVDATPDFPAQLENLMGSADCGKSKSANAADAVIASVSGIMITHAHMGHYLGLAYLGREAIVSQELRLLVGGRMARFLTDSAPWNDLVDSGAVRLELLVPGRTLKLGPGIRVLPISVPHRGEFSETLAFEFDGPERRVLYLPDIDDWKDLEPSLETRLRRVDRAYLDGTFFHSSELPDRDLSEIPHPTVRGTIDRLRGVDPEIRRRIRFIHLNHSNGLIRSDSPERRELQQAGYILAEEGERFSL